MEKKVNNIVSVSENNSVKVEISRNVAEASAMIYKLHDFFDVEDPRETYLQDSENIFAKLTSAIQSMVGCEAYWRIGEQSGK